MSPIPEAAPPGKIRIIGGKWRSRWLTVPAGEAVRPTADRVRETLFNWLTPYLPGASCLDLFAGTGVLGLEAVSRGADRAVLVESERRIAQQLSANVALLNTDRVEVIHSDARRLVENPPCRFDLVFVDPPFATDLMAAVLPSIAANCLTPSALVYLETPRHLPEIALPVGWRIMRGSETRRVRYQLIGTSGV